MSTALGSGPVTVLLDPRRSGAADMEVVRERLAGLTAGAGAVLDVTEALPTAAFSRRDRLNPGYADAEAAAATYGFAPIIRPVGGRLAVYGEGSLVLHLCAPHPEPREHIRQRFALLGEAIAEALRSLGVDARVGPVPGEYCDGEFSVNVAGRAKLAGTGQRIVRTGYLFSAVVMVHSAEPARKALTAAYRELAVPFDPATVGCVADSVPGVTLDQVRGSIVSALSGLMPGDRLRPRRGSARPEPATSTGGSCSGVLPAAGR